MAQQCTTTTRLAQGQCLRRHAWRGTIVVAARGRLHIAGAPAWMGEHGLPETAGLHEGEAYVVAQAGWIAIHALSDAEVVCVTHEAGLRPMLLRWRRATAAGLRRGWRIVARRAWSS